MDGETGGRVVVEPAKHHRVPPFPDRASMEGRGLPWASGGGRQGAGWGERRVEPSHPPPTPFPSHDNRKRGFGLSAVQLQWAAFTLSPAFEDVADALWCVYQG